MGYGGQGLLWHAGCSGTSRPGARSTRCRPTAGDGGEAQARSSSQLRGSRRSLQGLVRPSMLGSADEAFEASPCRLRSSSSPQQPSRSFEHSLLTLPRTHSRSDSSEHATGKVQVRPAPIRLPLEPADPALPTRFALDAHPLAGRSRCVKELPTLLSMRSSSSHSAARRGRARRRAVRSSSDRARAAEGILLTSIPRPLARRD